MKGTGELRWLPAVGSKGFTLLEVLAVMILVALLIGLIVPAVGRSREEARALTCMRNLQQLQMAWAMYADDHAGWLPAVKPGSLPGPDRWVSGWLDLGSSPDNTNTLYLTDSRFAQIGPYVGSAALFRCPSDPSSVQISGKTYPRVRSVSMNCWMNYQGSEPPPGQGYRIFRKLSDMAGPAPSSLWLLIDERFDSIDDGMFVVNLAARGIMAKIVDYPAAYHNNGAGIVFADGHAIIKRWADPRTTPSTHLSDLRLRVASSPHNVDIQWLQDHASAPLPSANASRTVIGDY